MTETDLEAIDVLLNAATPGPWVVDTTQDGFFVRGVGARDPIGPRAQDAVLIAIARKALPELIAEIRRLRAEIDDLRNGDGLEFSFVAHAKAELAKRDVIIDALSNEIARLTK